MQINEFYVIPETEEEERSIDDDIEFLLDVSLRHVNLTFTHYKEIINDRFNEWRIDGNF